MLMAARSFSSMRPTGAGSMMPNARLVRLAAYALILGFLGSTAAGQDGSGFREGALQRGPDGQLIFVPVDQLSEEDAEINRLDARSNEGAVGLSNPVEEPIPTGTIAVSIRDVAVLPPIGEGVTAIPARPNMMIPAGDGSGRLFAVDTNGPIQIIKNGRVLTTPFLDLRLVRDYFMFDSDQLGLLSLAFHPDFAKPGTKGYRKLYTVHSESTGGYGADRRVRVFESPTGESRHHDIVAEWTVHPERPDEVDPFSRREVLRFAQPEIDHNVGQIAFNPNAAPGDEDYGQLYIGVADGGPGEDPNLQGQDLTTPYGSILRINPLQSGESSYSVSYLNPLIATPGALPEIWAYGLRNPHRFTWDSAGEGQMIIADMGEYNLEEIDIGVQGANYGWSEREGTHVLNRAYAVKLKDLPDDDATFGFTYPAAQYDHDEGLAIVGGMVYRGKAIPALRGKYVFGDIVNGRLFYVDADGLENGSQAPVAELSIIHQGETGTLEELIANDQGRVDLRFGFDEAGEIYILSKSDGMVRKLVPPQ